MPLIPTRSGQSVFIQDPVEARNRFQEEWGQPSPAPEPKPEPVAKEPKKEVGGIEKFLRQTPAGLYMQGMEKLGETLGKIPIPFTEGVTVGEEVPRVAAEAARKVVADPVALAEQVSATTEGAVPAGLLGGPMTTGSVEADKERELKQAKNAEAAREALQKTGRDVEGFSYGIKPHTPIVGPLLSSDSDFVKENIKPKTPLGEFAAAVGSALLFDKGVSKLVNGPSVTGKTIQTADKLVDIWKTKDIQAGLRVVGTYLVKDVLPESVQDAMFFMPPPPAAIAKKLDDNQKRLTPEERILGAEAIRAETDEEFNYYFEQLKNVGYGAAALTVLRGSLYWANRYLNGINKGLPSSEADELATKAATPVAAADLQAEGTRVAVDTINQKLGKINSELYKRIDQNIGEITFAARNGAETALQRRSDIADDLTRVQGELNEIPDVGVDLIVAQTQLDDLQKSLAVKTPDDVAKKRVALEKRLETYQRQIAKNPDWPKQKTGTTLNRTKVRKAEQGLAKLDELELQQAKVAELEAAQLEFLSKVEELNAVVSEGEAGFLGFRNALNDARTLINGLDELNAQRVQYLESLNSIKFQENRLDEIDTDYSLKNSFGQAYGELKDLLNAAESASASNNLNDEFVRSFVDRVEEIHNKIIDAGGVAPIDIELPPGVTPEVVEQAAKQLAPRKQAPVVNTVPVTKTDGGEIVVDTDTIGARRAVTQATPNSNTEVPPQKIIEDNLEDLQLSQDPSKTFEDLQNFEKAYEDVWAEHRRVFEKTGSEIAAARATALRNTNANKYTQSFSNSAAVKAVFDAADRSKILPSQYGVAIRQLSSFLGNNSYLRQVAAFTESAEFGKDIQRNLHKVMVPAATLDSNAAATLKAADDLRKIMGGTEIEGLDRVTALSRFALEFETFTTNAKALNETMYGIGNALRLFAEKNRLLFDRADPGMLFGEFNLQLQALGDTNEFAEQLAKNSEAAKVELENRLGELFKKVREGGELGDDEITGFENLVEQVYATRGDLDKLNGLEMTADAVLANIQVNAPLSNLGTVASIPIQGVTETYLELSGQALSGTITGKAAKFLGKSEYAKGSLDEARIATDTILQTREVLGEALEATFNRFVYGKSITDPLQASQSAYEIRRTGGLRREEAIAQDLAATSLKVPFFDHVIKKDDTKLFDAINHARVFTKVFHDYFMPGEAWEKRSNMGKFLGLTTSGIRSMGLGKKSYYPGGENVNMTLFTQLSATADEFTTALFANAHARALVIKEVDDKIAAGVIKRSDRAEEISKGINKQMSDMYQPVKVGFDQKTIGYAVRDNQILNLTRAVNLTEELTGPLAGVAESVNAFRNAKSPLLRAFGRDIFPFLTSPINGIKRAVMISYGGEIAHAGYDTVAMGLKALPDDVVNLLPPKWKEGISNFESKYFSADPKVRNRAQGALALSMGINSLAWFILRDGNQDIAGGLENTYRETEGVRDPYTWKIGDWYLPYRYLPLLGNTIAFHANIRDLQQFAPNKDFSGLIALANASIANAVLETPAIAGFDRVIKALTSANQGDITRMQKLIAESIAKVGDPYLNLRKQVIQGFDPRKPASPTTRYIEKGFYERGKLGTVDGKDSLHAAIDGAFGVFGSSTEYSGVGLLADAVASYFQGDQELRQRSRKALWYGTPGETINARHAGKWYPLQAVLGRYWPFPDKLAEDPVAKEMVYNLISPPKTNLYHSDGVGINPTVLNDFNHFLNSEFQYYDPIEDKEYVGIHSYLKDFVTSKFYTQYPSVDSPFKQTVVPAGPLAFPSNVTDANWDRESNTRKAILQKEVDKLKEIAKEQFLLGNLPNQRYKAPAEMKALVLQNRQTKGLR